MKNGTSTSYYQPIDGEKTFKDWINFYNKLNYWSLVPILKFFNRKRYEGLSELLLKSKLLKGEKFGSLYRYEIKRGEAFFGVSPDGGKTFLNYHRGKVGGDYKESIKEITESIATIEAMIKTGFCVKY